MHDTGVEYIAHTDIQFLVYIRNVMLLKEKKKKKKRSEKVQGVPQSQTAALPRQQQEQTKPNKRKSNKRTKSTKISSLFPKRGNRNS